MDPPSNVRKFTISSSDYQSKCRDYQWSFNIHHLPKGIGLFELVDHHYGSKFQDNGKIEDFSCSASNFFFFFQNYRFWTTTNGTLRVLVVCYLIVLCNTVLNQRR